LSEGTVLAVGAGSIDKDGKRVPMDVRVGDKVQLQFSERNLVDGLQVLLPTYGGNALKIGEDEFTLYKSSEILAIINESSS
jgi:chaperonin GroES